MKNCFQPSHSEGPRPLRSYWPDNPEKPPANRSHWSADESVVRPHRAIFRGAIRERRNSLVMAALLGCTLEDLRNL